MPNCKNLAKQSTFQTKTMFAIGETVGLPEWIINDTCLVSFFFRKHLFKVRQADGEKFFCCQQCSKEFKKPSDLCRHMSVHSSKKRFSCKMCPRSFNNKSTLLAHQRIHLSSSGLSKPSLPKIPANIPKEAPLLNTGEALLPVLPRNAAVHQKSGKSFSERHHRCQICSAGFKKVSHLKEHVLTHIKEGSYPCVICQK